MKEINYHPVFRPLINFFVSLLIPTACIYLFAYKSFESINVLKSENRVLMDSVRNISPGINTVTLHDTIYKKNTLKDTIYKRQFVYDTVYKATIKRDTIKVTVYKPDNSCDKRIKILHDSLDLSYMNCKTLVDSRGRFKNNFDDYYKQMISKMRELGKDNNCSNQFKITTSFINDIKGLIKNY